MFHPVHHSVVAAIEPASACIAPLVYELYFICMLFACLQGQYNENDFKNSIIRNCLLKCLAVECFRHRDRPHGYFISQSME